MSGPERLLRRMSSPRRLAVYIAGSLLGLFAFYLVSSVTRQLSGTIASTAWVPSSGLLGAWVGFAIWSLVAVVIIWFVNGRRKVSLRLRRGATGYPHPGQRLPEEAPGYARPSAMACRARPTAHPTTVPLMRMNCRSRPSSNSS
jgi:hypothetical protein